MANIWSDSFTRADLASLGSSWKDIDNGFSITNNKALPKTAGPNLSIWNLAMNYVATGPDYSVSALINKPDPTYTAGVVGRYVTKDARNYYTAFTRTIAGAANDELELWKCVNGTLTQIGSDVIADWVNGDTLTLEMVGNTIRVLVNGVEKINQTGDAELTNNVGTAGLSFSGASGQADNFTVDEVGISIARHTSGAVTTTAARIAFGTNAAATVKVEYSTDAGMSGSTTTAGVAVDSSTDFTGKIDITGLTAGTQYYYRILVDDVVKQYTPFPKFKTAASASGVTKLAFGSCAIGFDLTISGGAPGVTPHDKAFDAALAWGPDAFAYIGDLGYTDGGMGSQATTLADYRYLCRSYASYRSRAAGFARLRREVPTYTMWDDHDFIDDFDASKPASYFTYGAQAFREYLSRGNPDALRSGADYYTFRLRDVEAFVTDSRQYRSANSSADNSSKTIIGSTQKQDLKDWLYDSNATVKLIISSTGINLRGPNDSWGAVGGFSTELREIFDYIKLHRISGVVWLSGDQHVNAANAIPYDGRTNYEFVASTLNQDSGSAILAPDGTTIFEVSTLTQAFGGVTIDTSAAPPTVKFDVIDSAGVVEDTTTLNLTTINNGLSAATAPATPNAPLAVLTSLTTARVSGEIPLKNGSHITSIVATSIPGGLTGSIVPVSQIGTYAIDVIGLTPGVLYTFTAHAVNSVGTSAESAESNGAGLGRTPAVRLMRWLM